GVSKSLAFNSGALYIIFPIIARKTTPTARKQRSKISTIFFHHFRLGRFFWACCSCCFSSFLEVLLFAIFFINFFFIKICLYVYIISNIIKEYNTNCKKAKKQNKHYFFPPFSLGAIFLGLLLLLLSFFS